MTSLRMWSDPDETRMWLLCLPPGGGGAHLYRDWAARLPAALGVAALEPPGRGSRSGESFALSAQDLVAEFAADCRALLNRPVVLYGHSMGALLALDLARRLRADRDWRPTALIAAASEPPDAAPVGGGTLDSVSSDELVSRLRAWGGTAEELLADPEYLASVLPVLRADLAMMAGRVEVAQAPLGCPVHVYLGADDDAVDAAAAAEGWARQSLDGSSVRIFPGGHFFPVQVVDELAAAITDDADAAVGGLLPRTPRRAARYGGATRMFDGRDRGGYGAWSTPTAAHGQSLPA
jgi:pyochelin biosynthetic protein PchC